MKTRLVETLLILTTAGSLLGGYYIFERIRLHNAMDQALIELIQRQGKGQSDAH